LLIVSLPFYLIWRKRRQTQVAKETAEDTEAASLGQQAQEDLRARRAIKTERGVRIALLIVGVLLIFLFRKPLFALLAPPQTITLQQLNAMPNPTASWQDYQIHDGMITNTGIRYLTSERDRKGRTTYKTHTYSMIQQGSSYLWVDSTINPDRLRLPVEGSLRTLTNDDQDRLVAYLTHSDTDMQYILEVNSMGSVLDFTLARLPILLLGVTAALFIFLPNVFKYLFSRFRP
jgi:hypothetical protein